MIEEYQSREIPLSSREKEGIRAIDKWYESRFKKLGIEVSYLETVSHVFKLSEVVSENEQATNLGDYKFGIIAIGSMGLPRELELIATQIIYAHEREHSTGMYVFSFHNDSVVDQGLILRNERFGVAALDDATALEEGSATRRQIDLYKVIAKQFPQESQVWEAEIRRTLLPELAGLSEADREQYLQIAFALVSLYPDTKEKYAMPYRDSYALYNLLDHNIPSFERLIERARVLDEMLPLARAIESAFGKDSFALVMSTTVDTAHDTLVKLKARLKKSKKA